MTFALLALFLGLALAVGLGGDSDSEPEAEVIEGTEGDDSLVGGNRDELINGLGGNDTIRDGGGNDTLEGGEGDDLLYSNLGDDWLDGGAGNDTLESWNGRDTLMGGDGDDELRMRSPEGGLADGGAGNDSIGWSGGDGTIRGGEGDDSIAVGGSVLPDVLVEGGEGTDLLGVGALASPLEINFTDDDSGAITDGTGVIDFTGIEVLELGYGAHRVDASATGAGVTIIAPRPDSYYGGSATIIGGGGDDVLSNGGVIDGGDGDDILIQGNGGIMTGGAGDDLFEVNHSIWVDGNGMFQNTGTSRVTDFTPGEDRVALEVRYVERYSLGEDSYTMTPPEVTIVEDLEANETRVMIGESTIIVLEGATGVDPSDIEITVTAL